MSHTFAVASQAPETKTFALGLSERLGCAEEYKNARQPSNPTRKQRRKNARHDVSGVVAEVHDPNSGVDVPQHAGHVAGARDDLAIVNESAATEVARVSAQLPRGLGASHRASRGGRRRAGLDRVDGADVVESSAGDKVAARRVGARHDPTRPERDGVDLVGRVGVPDDELAVLRGRDEVLLVGRPVHGVDLSEVTLERSAGLHDDSRERLDLGCLCSDYWDVKVIRRARQIGKIAAKKKMDKVRALLCQRGRGGGGRRRTASGDKAHHLQQFIA